MKTIGLIGGMSWESSLEYYRVINEEIKKRLGGYHSADIVMHSIDFDIVKQLQFAGEWDQAGVLLAKYAKNLEGAGADMILLCTNTMHKVAPEIENTISIPFLHIADGTGIKIKEAGYRRVALLGTAFTMEHEFYKGRLLEKFGLEVVIPEENDRKIIHDIIYNELCLGVINPDSRNEYIRVIDTMRINGCDCVILGCTEICLLIDQSMSPLPVFDTTRIHAEYAIDMALS